jgi:type II secretory pathway pseudopilin PulG
MQHRRRSRHLAWSGFTIVELLTVIGILAVLSGLLMGALGPARERARQSACTSNLRQIGLAVALYLDDYGARPPRFQGLADAGYLRSDAVLLCPDDSLRNWGGLYHDHYRDPQTPPESIRYSYLHPFGWPDWEWQHLMRAGSSAGIAACQLHGDLTDRESGILSYEGLILRLQLDGAVVRHRILWERGPGPLMIARPWLLFSDATPPDPAMEAP